jgi:GNAT superfamily N-acetyltransferase
MSIVSVQKGAGTAMMSHILQTCKKQGVKKIWGWSLVRYDAKKFYEKINLDEQYLLKH